MKTATFTSMATVILIACSLPAHADTIIKEITTIEPQTIENANMIDMSAFDRNSDGILSMKEVGEKLFDIFDLDGNRSIDNVEFTQKSLLTITPMEKETITYMDYAADSIVDEVTYNREEFMKVSQLARFADDTAGLSAAEFIREPFLALDDNDDKVIGAEEWQEAYAQLVKFPHEEKERYNS